MKFIKGFAVSNQQKALLAVLATAFLGGAMSPAIKNVLQNIPTFWFVFLRTLVSFIVLTPMVLKQRPNLKKQPGLLLTTALLATGNIIFFALGVKKTSANIAQSLYAGVPLLVLLFSSLILSTKVKLLQVLGLTIGMLGTLGLILLPVLSQGGINQGSLKGNLIISLAVGVYALYQTISKKTQKNYEPLVITWAFCLVSIFVSLPLALTQGQFLGLTQLFQPVVLLTVLYVSVFGTIGYYFLSQTAIKYGSPVLASLVTYLQSVFSYFWSAVILGEKVTWQLVLSSGLVFLGVALVNRAKRQKS